MKISIRETEHTLVVRPEGKMMVGPEANDFHEAIVNALENHKKKIIVDLSEVIYISSWGIGILMYGYATTKSSGGKFILASVSDKISNVLKTIKLDEIFEIYPTVGAALKA
jgi:anti-anti-sigma factor